MLTIHFVYTNDVTFKASQVLDFSFDEYEVRYRREVWTDTRISREKHTISKTDLLYAKVVDNDTGLVSIIPGLYEQFNVVPYGQAFHRQNSIDTQERQIAERREARRAEREERSHQRYMERRAKRKQEWLEKQGTVSTEQSTENIENTENTESIQSTSHSVEDANEVLTSTLLQNGISAEDFVTLSQLNLVKK